MTGHITREDRFEQGIRNGLPICFGYISVSFAFGIFAVSNGLTLWQSVIISMTNLTSAGQLAAVPIITGGLPLIELALSQLVINARYALMSVSLSQKLDYDVTVIDRFLVAFVNTDEIFAVASGRPGLVGKHYLRGLAVTPYFGWVTGTALGAAAGSILPAVITNALGIAIYGMFIAIIVPATRRSRPVLFATSGSCVISCILWYIPIFATISSGFAIIICAITVSVLCAIFFPLSDTPEANND